jgi:hypothetical protein
MAGADQKTEFLVSLDGLSKAETDSLVDNLLEELHRGGFKDVSRLREDERTQDFGATLILVLGTPAVIAAIKAIRDWSTRKNAAAIIRKKNGELVVKGLESKDVADVAKALNKT